MCQRHPIACIVPPELLRELILSGDAEARASALDGLMLDSTLRHQRAEATARTAPTLAPASIVSGGGTPHRTIYDMKHSTTKIGPVLRAEGQKPVKDVAANQAYDGFGATYDLWWKAYQRDSIDGQGMAINGLVHYGTKYDNAFWDGQGHMMFGDGDGSLFVGFTGSLDVIGHELAHGVTQYTANLTYSGQSGALNESISDVFGSLVKQHALGQDVTKANWLIGEDIVGPKLKVALRSMKAPGTANAYDKQPADMSKYVTTSDDNGGVHTNSGIPNHAFYLAATAIGGKAWEKAGVIWYAAMRDKQVTPNSSFRRFANATIRQAGQIYGTTSAEAQAVKGAWQQVKVNP